MVFVIKTNWKNLIRNYEMTSHQQRFLIFFAKHIRQEKHLNTSRMKHKNIERLYKKLQGFLAYFLSLGLVQKS